MAGHRFDSTILREYDIRGVVGKTLSVVDARTLGRGFGTLLRRAVGTRARGARVCVGYDGRLSSPELEAALVEGLSACGLTVLRVGRGPTPMLYFAAVTLEADGAIMVTGSHNPPAHNGFKLMRGKASFFGADIQTLGELVASGDFEDGPGTVEEHPVFDDYVAGLVADYAPGARDLTVAWDDGVGLGGDVAADLVEMHLHGAGVGEGEHEGGALAPPGADGAEQVGVGVALIGGQAWACSSLGPNSRAAVLLPQSGLVLKPDLDPRGLG